MNETLENRRFILTSGMMLLLSLSGILLLWFYKNSDITRLISFLLVVLISDLCIIFYLGLKSKKVFQTKSAFWIITAVYGLTFFAICFPNTLSIHTSVFFIGAILLAYVIDVNLGLVYACIFFVFTCVLNREISLDVLFFFLISLLLSILVQTISGFLSVLLLELITGLLFLVFGLILYSYQWSALLNPVLIFSFSFYFVILLLSFFLRQIISPLKEDTETHVNGTVQAQALTVKEESKVIDKKVSWVTAQGTPFITLQEVTSSTRTELPMEEDALAKSLEEILSPDFELLKRMKTESNRLYRHSKEVADLCSRVAEKTNSDSRLAYAGALYHEVGRLMGSNLLEESLVLAKEYHLPASVISILKQHNYKNELPQSSEAVIVMLSDNIITMYHFMKKQEKEVSIVKLIDNTFHMHFNKGTIEASGMTINQFNQLRKAYLSELVFDEDFMKGGNLE